MLIVIRDAREPSLVGEPGAVRGGLAVGGGEEQTCRGNARDTRERPLRAGRSDSSADTSVSSRCCRAGLTARFPLLLRRHGAFGPPCRSSRRLAQATRPLANGQHGRSHSACRLHRRHGRGADLGDRLIRERARTSAENVELRGRIADLNAALQRSEALLNLRDQRLIVWASDRQKVRNCSVRCPAKPARPTTGPAFLAFGRWLMPRSAAALDHAVIGLAREGYAVRPDGRNQYRPATGGPGPQDRRACHCPLHQPVGEFARAGPAEAGKPAARRRP